MADGLHRGHHIGFIASSDHLSTSASYAGVWAVAPTREAIFKAMRARRTYAATARIGLRVRVGDHWQGEIFATGHPPTFHIEARGTAIVESVEVVVDGARRVTVATPGTREVELHHRLDTTDLDLGDHFFYVSIRQADGNRAWSSPLWITLQDTSPATPPLRIRAVLAWRSLRKLFGL